MNLALLLILVAHGSSASASKPTIAIRTSLGEISVELEPTKAPATVANFLRYVEAGHYNWGRFHRTVTMANQPANNIKIEVIQGGVTPSREKDDFSPIKLERTSVTGLRHLDGTISMARNGPDTATSDFFICIGPQPELDFGGKRNPDGQGFAAFGRVVAGMNIVRRIQAHAAKEQTLTPAVPIFEITRMKSQRSL